MVYTIQNFWRPRLLAQRLPAAAGLIDGWSFVGQGLPTFREAPLSRSEETAATDPWTSSIVLVSAPGAVGKTTLARQVAFETGCVYIDLAEAEPVGAHSLTGGLVRSGLYDRWRESAVGVLVDGLDEARLRVTQGAFEAFLGDIDRISRDRALPTVLFGRTGAIQDAWLILHESTILEIGYYNEQDAVDLANAILRAERPESSHPQAERRAIELLLSRLREQTAIDGDRFAGYAPVLQAVAQRVVPERNPSQLVADIEAGGQPITLKTVVYEILRRERGKLSALDFIDTAVLGTLYSVDEQLDRLINHIYDASLPLVERLDPRDASTYDAALKTWVPEHPLLDGQGRPSSAVFDAIIAARALQRSDSAEAALRRELGRGAASANPFLAEFYGTDGEGAELTYLPAKHVGIIYNSLRARLSLGDSASLFIVAPEEGAADELLSTEVEITLGYRETNETKSLRFRSDQTETIYLGAHVEDVEISAAHACVEIGPAEEATFIAPISVQCETLVLNARTLIAEAAQGRGDAACFLEASAYRGSMDSVPILRGSVALSVSWPGAGAYPWTSFATDPTPIGDTRVDEALRRLRKFVIAFRSHGRGSLARYRAKLDHARMTKGYGQAVLDCMLREQILSVNGSMYVLNPDQLTARAGTNYTDCMARRFGNPTVEFVRRALQ